MSKSCKYLSMIQGRVWPLGYESLKDAVNHSKTVSEVTIYRYCKEDASDFTQIAKYRRGTRISSLRGLDTSKKKKKRKKAKR